MVDFEKVRYPRLHRHTDTQINEYSSSLGLSWQLRSGWTGSLGWQVGARLTETFLAAFMLVAS